MSLFPGNPRQGQCGQQIRALGGEGGEGGGVLARAPRCEISARERMGESGKINRFVVHLDPPPGPPNMAPVSRSARGGATRKKGPWTPPISLSHCLDKEPHPRFHFDSFSDFSKKAGFSPISWDPQKPVSGGGPENARFLLGRVWAKVAKFTDL